VKGMEPMQNASGKKHLHFIWQKTENCL